jgi:hypothetical protein
MRIGNGVIRGKAAGAALTLWAGAAGCGVEALRTHLQLSSLGPICGLDRPALFFLHCPACPAALALLAAGTAFAAISLGRRGGAVLSSVPRGAGAR